ncbi:MAG: IS630 family transposase [Candidatus Dormibacteraceae bacterium]
MGTLDARRLIFVDETGATITMTRRRARAPVGERAVDVVPRNQGTRTTLVSALGAAWIRAAMTLPGAINGATFRAFVEQVLGPTLEPGQIVVLDNLSAHKVEGIAALIEARGCHVLYLPAYSPDFAPIELADARIKNALRRTAARTTEALEAAIAEALSRVTADHARAWFTHCGYRFPAQSLCSPL